MSYPGAYLGFVFTSRSIVSSHFRAHPSSYPLLHIDAFNQALAKSRPGLDVASTSTLQELDPILWVSVPNTSEYEEGAWLNTACFHVEKEGMRILVPVSQESESFEMVRFARSQAELTEVHSAQ
jgi:AP-3 complex subunit mu